MRNEKSKQTVRLSGPTLKDRGTPPAAPCEELQRDIRVQHLVGTVTHYNVSGFVMVRCR